MTASELENVETEPRVDVLDSFENSDNIDMDALDRPILEQINSKADLTPLSESDKEQLREDQSYSDTVIESIGSVEEAQIYDDANLECTQVNGSDALTRTDIDYDQVDDKGRTNLQRMEKGLTPLDRDGNPIELHHIGQSSDAPLAELTFSEHHCGGHDTILHDKQKESEIDRTAFAKERAEHWQNRAEQVKQERLEA